MSDAYLVGGRVVMDIPKHTPLVLDTASGFVSIETTRNYDLKVRAFRWEY